MKTAVEIATEAVERIASVHAERLSGENAVVIAAAAVTADRLQHQEYANRDVVVRFGDQIFGLAFEAEIWDLEQMISEDAADYERDVVESRHRTLRQYGWDAAADSIREWWLEETGEGL